MEIIELYDETVSLNAIRKVVQLLDLLMTKEQHNLLKKRLSFNPKKLPLTTEELLAIVKQQDKNQFKQLHERYFQFIDAFQPLIEQSQRAKIIDHANQLQTLIDDCEDDNELDILELRLGHLLNLLEDIQ